MVIDWFWRWLDKHQRAHPHQGWRDYDGPNGATRIEVYRGWIAAFEARGITEWLAGQASLRLQGDPPGWPEHHLPALLRAAGEIRRERALAEERQRRLEERQQDERARRRREALRDRWGRLPEATQAQIRDEAAKAFPFLASFPGWLELACLEELERRSVAPQAKRRPRSVS